MRFVAVALNEVEEPFAKLADVIHRSITRKALAAGLFEEPALDHLVDGSVGSVIIRKPLTHSPQQFVFAVLDYPDAPMHGRRAQIEKQPSGRKNTMCFEEGMDHALVRHSSQRPREHRRVE